jgi:hypothetical protein
LSLLPRSTSNGFPPFSSPPQPCFPACKHQVQIQNCTSLQAAAITISPSHHQLTITTSISSSPKAAPVSPQTTIITPPVALPQFTATKPPPLSQFNHKHHRTHSTMEIHTAASLQSKCKPQFSCKSNTTHHHHNPADPQQPQSIPNCKLTSSHLPAQIEGAQPSSPCLFNPAPPPMPRICSLPSHHHHRSIDPNHAGDPSFPDRSPCSDQLPSRRRPK